jgi:hypothetical protein
MIVSDNSFFDFGTLGKLGYVPGWPGEEVYPPQPMVGQTRSMLENTQLRAARSKKSSSQIQATLPTWRNPKNSWQRLRKY